MIPRYTWNSWVERLKTAIGCPVDWEPVKCPPLLKKVLRLYWVELVEEFYQVDLEMSWYSQLNIAIGLREEDLRPIEINSAIWRNGAAADYVERTRCFKELRYANFEEYSKHCPRAGESRESIILRSKKGPALFYPSITYSQLAHFAAAIMEPNWRHLLQRDQKYFYIQDSSPIGSSLGEETDCLRLEVDYSSFLVHGHPILRREKPNDTSWLDEWDGELYYDVYDILYLPDIDEEWVTPLRDEIEEVSGD